MVSDTAVRGQTVVDRFNRGVLHRLHPGGGSKDPVTPGGAARPQELVPARQVLAVRVAGREADRQLVQLAHKRVVLVVELTELRKWCCKWGR